MPWASIGIPVAMSLLGASEQRKANSQAQDAADKANTANNALRDQAMPFALQNLQTNANLQKFYQNNPFNAQQMTGYQNQNNFIDNFNGQVAPSLLNFANGLMGQSYSRQRGGAPGSAAGYGGLLQSAGNAPSGGGLLAGPFVAPQHQNFGKIDFAAMNPYSAQNKTTENTAPTPETQGNFDEAAYYAANPDLLKNGWDRGAWAHYQMYGKGEGRAFTPKVK